MTRRERLMNSIKGLPVDRPPVCFYEINGLTQDESDPDPFNIYNSPSWLPLLELTRERSDRIVMRGMSFKETESDPMKELTSFRTFMKDGSRFTQTEIKFKGRTLSALSRRDPEVNTVWQIEHLLKGVDDLKLYLDLPESPAAAALPDVSEAEDAERRLGDTGIILIDTADPLCMAASLFSMEDMTVIAMTETELFHKLLERFARRLLPKVEAFAKAMPGRLWRIYGPEYASPPFMPPELFNEYVVRYDRPMVEAIRRHGGLPRIHSHGKLRQILDMIVSTGCIGLDPIEPPNQGDVELEYVRRNYGKALTLFGNIEITDIENLAPEKFKLKVEKALREGTFGEGRGFVLMPSACPYGRDVSDTTYRNYLTMVELAERWTTKTP